MQAPSRKVNVGIAANAVMVIAAWVGRTFYQIEIDAEVALAGAAIITFILQYIVPNAETSDA